MYIPKAFRVTDHDEIFSFVEENAFGQLVSTVEGRISSTHMPFLLSDDKQKIFGHFAKQNPQYSELDNQEALVTFLGRMITFRRLGTTPRVCQPAFIKQYTFMAYAVSSTIRKAVVENLTTKYESAMKNPWEPSYDPSLLGAIVCVEISITEIQCKYKLSQNRPAADKERVIAQLAGRGSISMADAMRKI
jgi:transcriptional regulator